MSNKELSFLIKVSKNSDGWWSAFSEELEVGEYGHYSPLEAVQGFSERFAIQASVELLKKLTEAE